MKLTAILTTPLAAGALLFAPATFADNKAAALDEMEAYLDFVDYGGATLFPEQIPKEDWKKFRKGGFDAAARATGPVKY